MDLEAVKRAKAYHDGTPEGPEKAHLSAVVTQVKSALAKDLPALPESDRAAVAWYIAELVMAFRIVPLMDASDSLAMTSDAYALAAVELLGWGDK